MIKRCQRGFGLALPEAEQARAETEAEGFHLHVEGARRPIVAQLMDQDHHPDQDQIPPNVL
jgi:hypothetical protein